jgi:histidinol-phosphate aminotransferase
MFASRIAGLRPYVPGEQPGPLPGGRPYIKLNANETPYPPSPHAVEAATALLAEGPGRLARYPDPDSSRLRAAIAGLLNRTGGVLCRYGTADVEVPGSGRSADVSVPGLGISADMVFVGNGSDEVLSLVYYAFFDSDRPLILSAHTYSFYPVYAQFYGVPVERVPLRGDFRVDGAAMGASASAARSSVILANPNAPTGQALSLRELSALLEAAPPDRVQVIDEAYADFGDESALALLGRFPNLAVVRTFSKSLSFAGMRLGYVVANPPLIRALVTVKNSFNHFPLDLVTQTAGAAACGDPRWYAENARRITAERERHAAWLRGQGWEVVPSKANFLFARKPGTPGRTVYEHCKRGGILIRHFDTPGIADLVRITIGTPAEMAALEAVLIA